MHGPWAPSLRTAYAMGALLLSDDGSFITAQTISVDGGVTFRP
jgi:hypothetical protein